MITSKILKSKTSTWAEKKAKLKLKFGTITDDDLNFDETHAYDMLNKLQVITMRTTRELQGILKTL